MAVSVSPGKVGPISFIWLKKLNKFVQINE